MFNESVFRPGIRCLVSAWLLAAALVGCSFAGNEPEKELSSVTPTPAAPMSPESTITPMPEAPIILAPTPSSRPAIPRPVMLGESLTDGILRFTLDRSTQRVDWETADTLRITDMSSQFFSIWSLQGDRFLPQVWVGVTGGQSLRSVWPEGGLAVSPDSNFVVHCVNDQFSLYPLDAGQPGNSLAEAQIPLSPTSTCGYEVIWSPDSSAFLVAPAGNYPNGSGEIYLWAVTDSEPAHLAEGNYPAWSRDSGRIAYLLPPGSDQPERMMLIDRSGTELWTAPVALTGSIPESLIWLGSSIVGVTYHHSHSFYRVIDGELISEWSSDMAAGFEAQPPSLSPNGRWLVLEHRSSDDLGTPHVSYLVYDTAAGGGSFELSAAADDILEFLKWSPDSSRFYFISRPAREHAILDPRTPFGLMVYEPAAGKLSMLFAQAVGAFLSPDLRWALVVFPSRDGTQAPWLAAGLWEVGTDRLVGRERVADEMFYAHPTEAGALDGVAWSPNSRRVAFVNTTRQLVVIDTDGTVQRMSACVRAHAWSADGAWLLADPIQWVQSSYSEAFLPEVQDGFLLFRLPLPQDLMDLACP